MNAEENIKRKFGDKEYTAYEATQRQRELERVMRKYGEESHLLELGGADEDTVLATKVRYQTASQEYAAFSKAMGLPTWISSLSVLCKPSSAMSFSS